MGTLNGAAALGLEAEGLTLREGSRPLGIVAVEVSAGLVGAAAAGGSGFASATGGGA